MVSLTAGLLDRFPNTVLRVEFHDVRTVKDSFRDKLGLCALVVTVKAARELTHLVF